MNLVYCQYFYLDDSLNLFLGYLKIHCNSIPSVQVFVFVASIVAIVKRMQCAQNVRIHNVATFKNVLIFLVVFFVSFFSQ